MTDDDKWMAQMRRGSLELCVLAILARGRRYGYDIAVSYTHLTLPTKRIV